MINSIHKIHVKPLVATTITTHSITMSKLNRNQKAMLFAEGIVERYQARGNQLPHRSKTCRMDPSREQVTPLSLSCLLFSCHSSPLSCQLSSIHLHTQEYKDAAKLNDWKQSLKGNRGTCSIDIRNYLDTHIPIWRDTIRAHHSDSTEDEDTVSVNSDCAVTTAIEAEVCHAMTSKFATTDAPPPLPSSSPLSSWSDLTSQPLHHDHSNHANSKNPSPLTCSAKRVDLKRKRVAAQEQEMDEEVLRQIKKDSELLLHLTYSGDRSFRSIVS